MLLLRFKARHLIKHNYGIKLIKTIGLRKPSIFKTTFVNHSSKIGMGFPDSSVGKESTCNAGDPGSIPGSGRSSGEGIGYPLQYS